MRVKAIYDMLRALKHRRDHCGSIDRTTLSPAFTFIRVRTNGRRQDGSYPNNKYAIDVEVGWGIFQVVMSHNKAFSLTQPLRLHPEHKTILKEAMELIADLEKRGRRQNVALDGSQTFEFVGVPADVARNLSGVAGLAASSSLRLTPF
jgi:hypothetical protein